MKALRQTIDEVDQLTDGLGLGIDPGIKKAVVALRVWEFPTTGSCQGHLDWGLPFPWIDIDNYDIPKENWEQNHQTMREEITRLLKKFYSSHGSAVVLYIQDKGIFGAFRLQSVQHDKDADPKNLEIYRKDMDAFADFLLEEAKAILSS